MSKHHTDKSLSDVHQSVDTTRKNRPAWRRILAFFGPAYLVSVGYMDPGNWATDLAGGSQFGYSLLWVLLMSNLMALLLQSLSARLGIVRNRDLAQANRETYPKGVNFILWVLAEIAIAATDLAEVLGMAIGLQLLTGLPLIYGVLFTVLDTFLLMLLQRWGMRKLEAFVVGLIFVIGASFFVQIFVASPNLKEVATGLIPTIPSHTALYIAIGIIGATVMPHNLYLHSALVQTRKFENTEKGIKRALKLNFIDSTIALNLAFLVNAAILILAATVFYKTGRTDVAEIKQAYELLPGALGSDFASKLFAVALIAAGQSSTITGTLAGQIVMEGYLRLRINPIVRRLITRMVAIVPAVIVLMIYGEDNVDTLLIFSQVLLSMQLGFAIIPLIHFVSDKKTMGVFVIKPIVKVMAWIITATLIYLNISMVLQQSSGFFTENSFWLWKFLIIAAGIGFLILLVYTIVYPVMLSRKKSAADSVVHEEPELLDLNDITPYKKIAITLDFTKNDTNVINHALQQGNKESEYILVHIVETVTANMYNHETHDIESKQDENYLRHYAQQLNDAGYTASVRMGFGKAAKEIVTIIKDTGANILVMGAHGHKGFKDFILGHTIDTVRHNLQIPVLIVNNDKKDA